MYTWFAAIFVAGLGHAFWDNSFHWLVSNDPETSILHMHWVRMSFISILLGISSIKSDPLPSQKILWWLAFSIFGFVLPSVCYTICSYLTGYRIAISIQTFIPLFILCLKQKWPNEAQCRSLIFAFMGTICLWLYTPWIDEYMDLWKIWFSLIAAFVQVFSLSIWFNMLSYIKSGQLKSIALGSFIGLGIFFITFVVWTPQHLASASMGKIDIWILVIIGCALSATCKFWVIGVASREISIDAVSIFECIHPLATLVIDIIYHKDEFRIEDTFAIIFICIGWILYPTKPI